MFSSGSFEKCSSDINDTTSPGRGNFSVGINPLGDENQQNIRIQLAVHRYNNSTGSSFMRSVNERNAPSSFKHEFLKTSQKYKNFDSDKEEAQNSVKKSHNQYQGVGNFPVVHLRKNKFINKPVKRATSSEFKIQLPDLPLNRFLNHSPDICLDTKTSTRSVLDVLQDLSRKRIHTKDDTEAGKRKCKGLGGDASLDIEAPYKPLFVTKNKGVNVTYRDSMTQTQEMLPLGSPQSKKNEVVFINDKDDPKAELRRKLARQNNEILASLSSSTLTYPIKRNSGKHTPGKEEGNQTELISKRSKYFSEENGERNLHNGGLSTKDLLTNKNNIDQTDKGDKKSKTVNANKISPSKDRLTAIFLEMQNTEGKLEVLGKNKATDEKENLKSPETVEKTADDKCSPSENNSKGDESVNNNVTVSLDTPKQVTNVDSNSSGNSINFTDSGAKSQPSVFNISKETITTVSQEVSVSVQNISANSTTTSPFILPITSNINFGFGTDSGSKVPVASTISSSLTQTPIFSTGFIQKDKSFNMSPGAEGNKANDAQENAKTGTSPQTGFGNTIPSLIFQNLSSGKGENQLQENGQKETDPKIFNFGAGDKSQNLTLTPVQKQTQEATVSEKDNTPKNPASQFSSPLILPTTTITGSPQSGFSTGAVQNSPLAVNSTTNTTTITTTIAATTTTTTNAATTTTTNAAAAAATTAAAVTGTVTTVSTVTSESQPTGPFFGFSDKTSTSVNQTTEKPQTFGFSFGQNAANLAQPSLFGGGVNTSLTVKPTPLTATEEKTGNNSGEGQEKPNQLNTPTNLFAQNTFSGNSFTSTPSFGQNVAVTSAQNTQNTQSMPFKFGEKTDANPKPSTENQAGTGIFDKKSQPVFTFGQKPPGQDELQASNQAKVTQANLFQSNVFTFGQKPSTPVTTSQSMGNQNLFGQNQSVQPNLFHQSTVSQPNTTSNTMLNPSSPFGISSQAGLNENKNQMPSFIQTTSSGGISMNNSFTQNKLSVPTFGQSTPAFNQTPTANMSNETNIFGANSTQSTPAFGSAPSVQNNPFSQPFDNNANKQQNNNNPGSNFFMQSSTTQNSGFGQSTGFGSNNFGQNVQSDNNIFGQKPQIGGFDTSQNVQANVFGQSSMSQTFPTQAPFTFGSPSVSSTTSGFTLNPSTAASVFTFGNTAKTTAAPTSSFGFSSSSQPSSTGQSLITFNNQSNNNSAFKFGSSAGSSSGGSTGVFFDSTPSTSETPKPVAPVFNFGSSQTPSSNTGFNFGATPTPVFSFGDSNAAANKTSKFSFGATQPNTGMFNSGVTPSPTMPLQGVFSIGSGSTQPRSRNATARARRRT